MNTEVKEPTRNERRFTALNKAIEAFFQVRRINEARPYLDIAGKQAEQGASFFRSSTARLTLPFSGEDLLKYAEAVQTLEVMNEAAQSYEIQLFDAAVQVTLSFFEDYFPDYITNNYMTVVSADFDNKPINVMLLRLGMLRYFQDTDQIMGYLQFAGVGDHSDIDYLANLVIDRQGVWTVSHLCRAYEDTIKSGILPLTHPDAEARAQRMATEPWVQLRKRIDEISLAMGVDRRSPIKVDLRQTHPRPLSSQTDGIYPGGSRWRVLSNDLGPWTVPSQPLTYTREMFTSSTTSPADAKLPQTFDQNNTDFISQEVKEAFLRRHPQMVPYAWCGPNWTDPILTDSQMAQLKAEEPKFLIDLSRGGHGSDLEGLQRFFESPTLSGQLFRSYLIYATGQDVIFDHPNTYVVEEKDNLLNITTSSTTGMSRLVFHKRDEAIKMPYPKVVQIRYAKWKEKDEWRKSQVSTGQAQSPGLAVLKKDGSTEPFNLSKMSASLDVSGLSAKIEDKMQQHPDRFLRSETKEAPPGLTFTKTERSDGK